MFTGIVSEIATVTASKIINNQQQLWINTTLNNWQLGESIAIDGMCVTVTDTQDTQFACDISPESLRLTIAKHYQAGTPVHLERALRLQDRLGGHWVTGHIDDTITLNARETQSDALQLQFNGIKLAHKAYLVPKGSVAINGVSLTINEINQDQFTVMLIPHTLNHTTLAALKQHDTVNIEYDWMAKQLFHQLQRYCPQSEVSS